MRKTDRKRLFRSHGCEKTDMRVFTRVADDSYKVFFVHFFHGRAET